MGTSTQNQLGEYPCRNRALQALELLPCVVPNGFLARSTFTRYKRQFAGNERCGDDIWGIAVIKLAMALNPVLGGTETHWDETNPSTTCFLGRDFHTRFGMSRDRFKKLKRDLSCGGVQADDPWGEIRPFVTAFNTNRKESVRPGLHLVADELMSLWESDDLEVRHVGLPLNCVSLAIGVPNLRQCMTAGAT